MDELAVGRRTRAESMQSTVLKAKVCLVGDEAVGKTSLIRRYVLDQLDDAYETTLGAKITKKELDIPIEENHIEAHLDLMIWDVMGHPGFRELLQKAYFYHARGVPAVADLTRRSTSRAWQAGSTRSGASSGRVPVLIAVNKADLAVNAECGPEEIRGIAEGSLLHVCVTNIDRLAPAPSSF